jgi:hypothetical protein
MFIPWLFPGYLHTVAVPRYPLMKKMGGLQGWSGYFGGEKNLLPFSGIEPLIVHLIVRSPLKS